MKKYNELAAEEVLKRTIAALTENGIEASLAASGEEAKSKVLAMLPAGAEVLTMTSITLDTIGLTKEINESGKYAAVRPVLSSMNPATQIREMRKLAAAPDFAVGSAHAVTETGSVLVASMTGSQLPAYAYGAGLLIWVVGGQKVVRDVEEGLRRIREYSLGLESERARKAYGIPGSDVGKVLIFSREVQPGRVKLILINEVLGF